jgi:hypothetical protein
VNQVVGTAQLRVGFQSSFGSDGQPAGGLNAVWFFQLPKLTLGNGVSIDGAHFITTLLDENATSPITPRFNADLYALGFVSAPTIVADGTFFFAGQDQTGPGLGAGQTIQKIDDDVFVIFQDWQEVNSVSPKHPKPIGSDLSADQNLAGYIESIYLNPAFPNTGNEYLVMRLNPDRAANETYEENGVTQFFGKGTTRYRVAANESSTLTSTGTVDYTDLVPTRLDLYASVPEPTSIGLLALGGLIAGASSRRVKFRISDQR